MALPEHLPHTEHSRTPEAPSFAEGQVALQARLLAATIPQGNNELLNPSNTAIEAFTPESFGEKQQRDYTVVKNASVKERTHYWEQRSAVSANDRYQTWTKETTQAFTNAKDFLATQKGQQWASFFQKLDINAATFTETDAQTLYATYFSPQQEKTNVDKFVKKVLAAHTDENGRFNHDAFTKNRDAVQWVANLFGEKSAQVMTQITDGQTKSAQQLADQANAATAEGTPRRNTLTPKEQELLAFLYTPLETKQILPSSPQTPESPPEPAPISPPTLSQEPPLTPSAQETEPPPPIVAPTPDTPPVDTPLPNIAQDVQVQPIAPQTTPDTFTPIPAQAEPVTPATPPEMQPTPPTTPEDVVQSPPPDIAVPATIDHTTTPEQDRQTIMRMLDEQVPALYSPHVINRLEALRQQRLHQLLLASKDFHDHFL